MILIEREAPHDIAAREALLDRSFGPHRHRKTVARLRRGRLPAEGLAFALRVNGLFAGTLRLWNIAAGTAGPALLLGPIAIAPAQRSRGFGAMLMRHALAEADAHGHRAVLLVGDAPYYARFGFAPETTGGLILPGPVDRARFLGLALAPGALAEATGLVTAAGAKVLPAKQDQILAA